MTLAEVIALINSDIVPNGNNEITANVLRPILIEMLQQPNDLIGDLGDLNTDSSDTLVDAINSVNNALSDVEGLVVLSGQGDPNGQSFPTLSIADLYSEIDGLGSPLALWIYDGTKFIRLSDKYLSYEIPQALTPAEQLTARSNIGAASLEDVGNIIDDTQASDDTTYSSNIIDQKLNLKLDAEDLNGLLENPTYDSDTHIFTMDVVGGGIFSIDFPIEALITNVDLDDDNNLVITFEDGSVTTVPLNTLLVGVVKSVNGKSPNSQGQVVITAEDIADLPTNYITTNTNQTGLTGDKTTSGNWQVGTLRIQPSGAGPVFEQPVLELSDSGTASGNIIPIAFSFGSNYNPNTFIKVLGRGSDNANGGDFQFWSKDIKHTTINNIGILTTNQLRKAGQTDASVLLAGGGHRPVSDFALAGSLGGYLPLSGGTMTGNINWNNASGLSFNNANRVRFTENATIISGDTTGTTLGVVFRPVNTGTSTNQVSIDANGQINTANHGNSSQWKQAYDWGDFRDYGLGLSQNTPWMNDGNEGLPNGFYRGGGLNAVNLPYNYRYAPIISLNRNTANYKIAIYQDSLGFQDNNNNWYQTYHTGNFNPDDYALVTQLTGYAIDSQVLHKTGDEVKDGHLQTKGVYPSIPPISDANDFASFYANVPLGISTFLSSGAGSFFNYPTPYGQVVNVVGTASNSSSDRITQYFYDRDSDDVFFRRIKASASDGWRKIYHTGNFNPAQYVLQSALNSQLANYVPINGVTTINGTKTFTSAPIVPNGTLNGHAVNLGQLNDALDGNYLPLAGGTMDNGSVINWNSGASAVIQQGGNNRIRATFSNTFISSSVSGTTDGIYLRPRGDINATGQVRINGNGQITTHSHGDSSQWHEAYLAIADKANTDGSNTTGGTWKIDELTSDEVGNYIKTEVFNNSIIGIPPTDALGSADGVLLMRGGSPIAIAENTNPDWDGYIYRAGEPKAGYPSEAQTGNYLIESKHRFRVHKHENLDDLVAGVGSVILNPYNAIEHQYFDVNIIEAMDSLEIDIQSPEQDEITGFAISRNNYGQRISVNVRNNTNVTFTNVQGVQFPNRGQPGVYKFIWDGLWLFDGYSPNEF